MITTQLLQNLVELERRIANLIRIGTVKSVEGRTAKVQIGAIETPNLLFLTMRASQDKTWWAPGIGEQVLVLSPDGEIANGVILPSLYQDAFQPPSTDVDLAVFEFSDGAIISYDRAAHHLRFALPDGATTELVSDGGIEFTGPMTLNGDLQHNGSNTTTGTIHAQESISSDAEVSDSVRSMQEDRGIYNAHDSHPPNDQ